MSDTVTKQSKAGSGSYFAAKSVITPKGAVMQVTRLKLSATGSRMLKSNSKGISSGVAASTEDNKQDEACAS